MIRPTTQTTTLGRWVRFLGETISEISRRTGIAYATVEATVNRGKTGTPNMCKIAADLYVPLEFALTIDPLDPFAASIGTEALLKCTRRRMLPEGGLK